jgi:hypothetical protein
MPSLRVPSLMLPSVLPTPAAVRSFNDNFHSYEPAFWELLYEGRRYLGSATDAALRDRHRSVIRNMKALICPYRHRIPIQSPMSSWYWCRKEHETRLELFLRGLTKPSEVFDVAETSIGPPKDDIVFRYAAPDVIRDFMAGRIQVRPASFYHDTALGEARSDHETEKSCTVPGQNMHMIDRNGNKVAIIGDMRRTSSIHDYYVLCCSSEWDVSLKDEFGGACAEVRDVEQFAERLNKAFCGQLGGWDFYHIPMQYFDPLDGSLAQVIDPGIAKDFRFAYQREYRFLWMHPLGHDACGIKHLDLGPLTDIASRK